MGRVFINGVEHDGEITSIRFDEKAEVVTSPLVTSGRFEMVFDAHPGALEQLARLVESMPRIDVPPMRLTGHRGNSSSASLYTLARRYTYGGRKGRRARLRMVEGAFGPTPCEFKAGERHELAFACPYPFQKG